MSESSRPNRTLVPLCLAAALAALEAGDGPPHRHDQPGGHVIEGSTFRNSSNGMRVVGRSAEPIVIRGNRFINTFQALVINGGTAHFLDNDISTPDPAEVPIHGRNSRMNMRLLRATHG